MKISSADLRTAAAFLEEEGLERCRPADRERLSNAVSYLRFAADQREEYEARQREQDPRMQRLRAALGRVWSGRGSRLAGRAG